MGARILAADIGGTNSRFAQFEVAGGDLKFVDSTWLQTAGAKTFGELLTQLKQSTFTLKPEDADVCVFAVAGPVERGVFCRPPLIPWTVDLANAQGDFGLKDFGLINDFMAQAFACRSEIGRKAQKILAGTVDETGAVATIGAGTGLGKAILLSDGSGGYVGGPSEGGHTNFCPETDREFEMFNFLKGRLGGDYLTWNDVVSGRGLAFVHEFLTKTKLEPKDVAANFDKFTETLEWAATFYGRVCRNFALETLCFGGMFIAGGVAAKNPILVQHANFEKAFRNSKVHRAVLEKIPVFLIDNQDSGLWGSGFYGQQQLNRRGAA